MKAYEHLQKHLQPGAVYRRSDLLSWSNAIDRHLDKLLKNKVLKKLSGGLYYFPSKTSFGEMPPTEENLVSAFLKDSHFLILHPSLYNSLGLGATQLYNETVVYNHKRHGVFELGKLKYRFVRKHFFPEKITEAFLLIDFLNNVKNLPENTASLLQAAANKLKKMNHKSVQDTAFKYGGVGTKKFVSQVLQSKLH